MNAIVQLLIKHGYPALFASVFACQMCLPVPAILFLISAGALAGSARLSWRSPSALPSSPACWPTRCGMKPVEGGVTASCTSFTAAR